jgi:glycosyltransferase involved in cell wall biosynthesis
MNIPTISVIVPVYNVEQYLRKCLDSILNQTFTDFELLLINDGSPDTSGQICDEYALKDSRIRVFHKENEGVSATREFGVINALGDYIQFIDSDDWIECNMFDEMYHTAIRTNADIVGCNFYAEYKKNRIYYNVFYSNKNSFFSAVVSGYWAVLWKILIKKNLFVENNIHFPPQLNGGEDYVVVVQLLFFAVIICCIPMPFYHYDKYNSSSLMNLKTIENYMFQIKATNIVTDFLANKNMSKDFEQEILTRKFLAKENFLWSNYHLWLNIFPESSHIWRSIDWIKYQKRYIYWIAEKKQYFIMRIICFLRHVVKKLKKQ